MPQIFNTVASALGALAAVLGLILLIGRGARLAGFARATKSRRLANRPHRLALQETLMLDRTRRLHLVQCDGREMVVLVGGTSDILVGWLPVNSAAA